MNSSKGKSAVVPAEYETPLVGRVLGCSILLLSMGVVVGWYFCGLSFARSIFIGGLLVNGSFWLLKKDAQRLLWRIGQTGDGVVNFEKTRFVLRSLARLFVLGLVLFGIAAEVPIDAIGLTLGFTTVAVSIVIIGLGTSRCWMPKKA